MLQAARGIDKESDTPGASSKLLQLTLFEFEDTPVEPNWVRVNTSAVRVENSRAFGGPWLALQLIQQLKLDEFLNKHLPKGKEHIQWSLTSMILVIARLLDPSSELYVSEQWYPQRRASSIGTVVDTVGGRCSSNGYGIRDTRYEIDASHVHRNIKKYFWKSSDSDCRPEFV